MLEGKVALVTGSDGGLGLAFARAFAAHGCGVVLNGPPGRARPDELHDHRWVAADVGDAGALERMFGDLGRVDIVVNNAVVRHFHRVEEFPPAQWERAMAVNVSAAFHTARLALPGMRSRGWGRIINLASIYSSRAVENRIDYVVSKHAIVGLTRAIALEVAKTGVTCNALQPGWVHTPHAERQIAERMAASGESREAAIAALLGVRQPSGRIVPPEDVAALAVFLCSDAGANINGAVLPVDGGWTTR